MSIKKREYVHRKALTAACAELDVMFEHQRFLWIEYPTDVEYVVCKFKRYGRWKDPHYYEMLDAFHAALVERNFNPEISYELYGLGWKLLLRLRQAARRVRTLASDGGSLCSIVVQRLRHPFEYTRHA